MAERILGDVRLVRADNPGPLTGAGTNTWLIGRGDVAVLDPGPASDAHLSEILRALGTGERISHILVSHTHLDHSGLVSALAAATGAVTAGFGPAFAGRSQVMERLATHGMQGGGEGIDLQFQPDLVLADGDTVKSGGW